MDIGLATTDSESQDFGFAVSSGSGLIVMRSTSAMRRSPGDTGRSSVESEVAVGTMRSPCSLRGHDGADLVAASYGEGLFEARIGTQARFRLGANCQWQRVPCALSGMSS